MSPKHVASLSSVDVKETAQTVSVVKSILFVHHCVIVNAINDECATIKL